MNDGRPEVKGNDGWGWQGGSGRRGWFVRVGSGGINPFCSLMKNDMSNRNQYNHDRVWEELLR